MQKSKIESIGKCFVQWVQSKLKLAADGVVGIEGKAQRGTAKKGSPHSFVHIESAWAATHHLTLGQLKVDGKSNEITAIPKLLDVLDVEGTIVTIDAMGCQTDIAENMSLIRRVALNMLKQEKSAKCGIEIKRQAAGWDNEYLLKVIGVKSFS